MIVDQLRDAARAQLPVRLDRKRGAWNFASVYGFVIGVSGGWVALQTLEDAAYVDGFTAVKLADVTAVVDEGDSDYVERVVAAVGRPQVDFVLPEQASTHRVLQAASDHSALVCIHFEHELDDPMFVGKITDLSARKYAIQLINPRGVWDAEPSRWWYGDVTRVGFADRYSTTLAKFGDERPTKAGGRGE